MIAVRKQLKTVFSSIFKDLGLEERWGDVAVSDRPDLAHYQCNGALGAAKALKKNPRELATQVEAQAKAKLGELWGEGSIELSIAGPGFINVKLGDALLARLTTELTQDKRLAVPKVSAPRNVVIDYGGPNVAKTMHVGHLRSSIIGDALYKIYRFAGDTAIGDNHLGDWGTPMGMLICTVREEQPSLPYFVEGATGPFPSESPVTIEDLERMYPQASKRFKDDPAFAKLSIEATDRLQKGDPAYKALWKHFADTTIRELSRDFASLGITFDHWLGESFYEEKMPPMVERMKKEGFTEISEGALVVPLETEQDPDAPPLILIKSGGGFLYHTSDLATVEYRVNHFKAKLVLYVVDKRQSLHFKQVFAVAKRTGLQKDCELVHSAFGTMNGKDGKPFKTREGGVLKLKDMISMIKEQAATRLKEMELQYSDEEMDSISTKVGIATLKYADLKNNRVSDYVFDLERFSQFEGNTGPYLLYATVRIKSILRKAAEQSLKAGSCVAPTRPEERTLMLELMRFPDAFEKAYSAYEPHHLCDYGFQLSQAFNSFYKECHILKEPDAARQASWLSLCGLTHDTLSLCQELLGISIPERM